jgi:hypothetical protein
LLRLTTVLPCLPPAPPPTASILMRDREKSLITRIILFWKWGSKNPNFLIVSLQTKDTKWKKGFWIWWTGSIYIQLYWALGPFLKILFTPELPSWKTNNNI